MNRHFAWATCFLALLVPSLVLAKAPSIRRSGQPFTVLFQATGEYSYSSNAADQLSGVHYTKWLRNSGVASLGLGAVYLKNIYSGLRYEYWVASRQYDLNGAMRTDFLSLNGPVIEAGYFSGYSRFFVLATVGAFYPLKNEVRSTGLEAGTYTRSGRTIGYEARALVGVSFANFYSLLLTAGYRYVCLGNLTRGDVAYVPGGSDLFLSGPFAGIGIGLHL